MRLEKGTFCTVPIKMLKGLSPYVQTVFLWICHHANNDGVCWPSLETLCQECGMGRTRLINTIKYLIKIHYIEKRRRKQQSSVYHVIIQNQEVQDTDFNKIKKYATRTTRSTPNVLLDPPLSIYELNQKELKPNIYVQQPLFDQFWFAYPIHKSKEDALKAFKKIPMNEVLLKTILDALELQKKEREIKEQNREFVPAWKLPATWLNGKCWQDEVNLTVKLEKSNDKRTRSQLASDIVWESCKGTIDELLGKAP